MQLLLSWKQGITALLSHGFKKMYLHFYLFVCDDMNLLLGRMNTLKIILKHSKEALLEIKVCDNKDGSIMIKKDTIKSCH
jgi:hypothetical protein